ncbi:MAG: sugar ABC transporter permease, partial [Clostridia bacterium]|nr:sugar ABC transporter permease [Clostridia bacterium]
YLWLVINPIAQSLFLSLYQWETLSTKHFAGLDNYRLVIRDKWFWLSLRNSLIFMAATTVLQVVIGFALGYVVYLQMKGHRFFKTVFFLPTILPAVAVGFVWDHIYGSNMGLFKPLVEALGGEYVNPLASSQTALIAVILAQVWASCGVQVIIFNAGFMHMPADVIESAMLDGCSGFKLIRHAVIPLSWDIIKMVVILQIVGALRAFDLIVIMTNGGPVHATEVLPLHLYINAFTYFKLGYGNVIAVVIFVLAMSMTMIMRRIMYRESIN